MSKSGDIALSFLCPSQSLNLALLIMLGDYVTKGACSKSVGKLADMVTFPTNIIDHPG